MRICCISNMYPSAGEPDYGAFVADMCEALEHRGHRVAIAAIASRATGRVRTPTKYARLLLDAVRAARGADVVYAHYLFPTGSIAAIAAAIARVPWVVTAHGGDVANLANPGVRRATRLSIARADTVIAVSRDLVDRMRTAGLTPARIAVVNMGVDVERFVPADRAAARSRLGLPVGPPLLLAVGGITDRKQPLELVRAAARLLDHHPDLHLAFVGDGPLADRIAPLAAELGIPAERIHRPGVVPHAAVADWMAAGDVLSMVSRNEPLGVVALEALASGRPVVATSVGGAAEVVPDRGPGRIVAPGDTAAHAAALGELLENPPPVDTARAVAVTHALAHQAARVEETLQAAVDRRAAGRVRH